MLTIASRYMDGPESNSGYAFGRVPNHTLVHEVVRRSFITGKIEVVTRLNDKCQSEKCRFTNRDEAVAYIESCRR